MNIRASICDIKLVLKEEEKTFLKENHLQGYASSLICYGLYYKGQLVQLMSFGKPRFNKNYQWELIRDCTRKNTIVHGGVSKLWGHFIKNNSCCTCICYSYPHDKELVTKYIDYCEFNNIKQAQLTKKVYYIGKFNGEEQEISLPLLRRYGVDRILGTHYGFNYGSNEEILINELGFKKDIREEIDPQVDIYFPFGVLYKITDENTSQFYIGETTNEQSWNKGYLGSGKLWIKHLNKYPHHKYKREILKSNFKTPLDLYNTEIKIIKKYIENPLCKNVKTDTQTARPELLGCPECGSKNGKHKKICSQYKHTKQCSECGSEYGAHKKNCSHYKKRKTPLPCPECGGRQGTHYKTCSKYSLQLVPCAICGNIGKHKSTCKYAKRKPPCPECGGKDGKHKKICSQHRVFQPCSECGAVHGHHYKTCSHYKMGTPCPECGSYRGNHKKICSQYKIGNK